jgi:hypothetical protein
MMTRSWCGKAVASFSDVPAAVERFAHLAAAPAAFQRVGAVLIGDPPGHIVTAGEARQDGAVIRYEGQFAVTYPSSSFAGTITGSVDSDTQPPRDEGRLTITGGKGEFAGATGEGSYRGTLIGPFEDGAVMVYDIEATLSLPGDGTGPGA